MRFKYFLFGFISILFISCVSTPNTPDVVVNENENSSSSTNQEVKSTKEESKDSVKDYVSFDPSTISREQYEEEKSEIQILVEKLNKITSAKDYVGWLNFISEEYKNYYSDPEVLKAQTSRLPVKNLSLKNLQDYFRFVFVVSRQNCRVDDINYITPTRVKVLQREPNKVLIIYNLEKFDGYWKIVLESN